MKKLFGTILCSVFCAAAAAQSQPFVRRSVIEEYTGTWCGFCPRGTVALQRLTEQFGDRCIAIAIHSGDNEPMQIATYPDVKPSDHGVPICTIDRVAALDPYSGSGDRGATHFGIDLDFEAALSMPAEAGLELSAQWNDERQWNVRFDATTTFANSSAYAPYRLAFILVEDGMKGEGSSWEQVNYYSHEEGESNYQDDDMAFWRAAPYHVTGMEYNHVAVNTLGIKSGIANSITAPITAMQPQAYSNTVTTLSNKVIQDKTRLSAVALLLSTATGEIVNAAKASIRPYGDLIKGDVNGDGTVDVADISAVITAMAGGSGTEPRNADVNGDGTVDVADISAIITAMAGVTV